MSDLKNIFDSSFDKEKQKYEYGVECEINAMQREEEIKALKHEQKKSRMKKFHELFLAFGIHILFILGIMFAVSIIGLVYNGWWTNLSNLFIGIIAS